jgi:hypothetical protein
MQPSMNEILNEQRRLRLLEKGVELLTFSQYWYSDEILSRQLKAWGADGKEIKLDDEIGAWIVWSVYSVLSPVRHMANEKVFGWQVRNNCLQIAAPNLDFTNLYGHVDDLQNESESEELNAYWEAAKKWGGYSNPNYEYTLSENLKTMLEASRWSTEIHDAETQLELYLHDSDEFVRSSIAANPNVSEETLVQLGYDSSAFVRNSVRMNPATPRWLLDSLGGMLE